MIGTDLDLSIVPKNKDMRTLSKIMTGLALAAVLASCLHPPPAPPRPPEPPRPHGR